MKRFLALVLFAVGLSSARSATHVAAGLSGIDSGGTYIDGGYPGVAGNVQTNEISADDFVSGDVT